MIAFDAPRTGPVLGETVPPALLPLLEQLGLDGQFLAECPKIDSTGVASCWGSPEPAFQDYMREPGGRGWHLDRAAFNRFLRESVERSGVVIARKSAAVSDLKGTIAINASGRGSSLRLPGAGPPEAVDHLLATARYWSCAADGEYALIEAHPEGWCYTAPQPGGRMISVWFTDPEIARNRSAPDSLPAGLIESSARLRGATAEPGWIAASARTWRRRCVTGPGWIAAGDAAAAWDPLSGAGIVRALSSGIEAARAVLSHLGGDRSAFERYQEICGQRFERYLADRTAYYRSEARWPDLAFWRYRRDSTWTDSSRSVRQ